MAGEGHYWANLTYEAKAMIIGTYENAASDGCVTGVSLSTSELFSDKDMAAQQAIKLLGKCPNRKVSNQSSMSKTIGIMDHAYGKPGASIIPSSILIKLSIEAYSKGKSQVDPKVLQRWMKVSIK